MVPELPLFHPSDLEEARIASAREREFWALMLGAAALKVVLVDKFKRWRDLRDKLNRPVLPLISWARHNINK